MGDWSRGVCPEPHRNEPENVPPPDTTSQEWQRAPADWGRDVAPEPRRAAYPGRLIP